ncbi:MAG: tetraprenyl-beta-curcumene synthase family protein [Candidatus Eremiobacteraeota bacterium]|nr:tetraprenyl-beta-curcumene synthase family protein [Candidatus Eremiobacteraeota bacterium]
MLDSEIRFAVVHVTTSPIRLRTLLEGGIDGALDLARFLRTIVPLTKTALTRIERLAERIPDERLRHEARTSIRAKAYHVAGAAILATFLPPIARRHYIEIVTPLETIYDFLDNLCDRHPDVPVDAYPVLHQALSDALDPAAPLHDYYQKGPSGDDGDYLQLLVVRTRRALVRLGGYERLLPHFKEAARLYTELQTFKHYPKAERENACIAWHETHREQFGDFSWWEFACAAGSQFQVYAPLFALFCSEPSQIDPAFHAYFPAFSALHVLLDYFIDQAEDREHGELNFIDCYGSGEAFRGRAATLARRARTGFEALSTPRAHDFALRIMCLFYLTHPKVFEEGLNDEAELLLRALFPPFACAAQRADTPRRKRSGER